MSEDDRKIKICASCLCDNLSNLEIGDVLEIVPFHDCNLGCEFIIRNKKKKAN